MSKARIPLITIIGVPNTGKSTLFNRLIGQRKALVHTDAGMTRDIYKKSFAINGKEFYLQDSGGFFPDSHIITDEINKRIFKEAQASDLIIFLFDGKRDLLGYEKDLFLDIKKINPNIIPVVNKVDNPETFILSPSYYQLKQDFLFVSAEHNLEVETVLEAIEKKFENHIKSMAKADIEAAKTRISIVGKPNVGKSSIVNKILQDDLVIVSPIPGTTRDSVDLEVKRYNKTFILVDNAGIRKLKKVKERTESAAVIRAEKDIRSADIVIFVIDISKRIDQNDLLIAHKILKSARPLVVACNKWDLVADADTDTDKRRGQSLLSRAKEKLNFFYFAPFILVSAVTGKNIFNLLDRAAAIHTKLSGKIKTSYLNKVVLQISKEKKILTETNRPFNPRYVSIESYRPFFIRFHAGSSHKLKPFHEIYLKKRISEALDLEGIPVFFKISSKKKK
ncbi:MAG: ribosome biogenesis GTPase Der [Candidatus Aminicenantes bacterium]|nr:ribosome biogenesis GTPase Der [Candidatus Aminicenantes bacterium]NIM81672.1 ribosome biogenesis GTPase Der [Candidatus Aminicenantes bacterium]NIN21043.1 ribosome biogenesis GTPase Der [Candidatus Aminicenantes bacterium]NIN44865.1 ribosome biogenesis GTPase Der [Candidatus Aminicenantes bacterium]NIN87679.1 ribosome biogenesis GTPase Der [Candidatus Aminicenantes bacterium]